MKFMITFNHIDGVWEKLTPSERERHGTWLKEFVRDLATEKHAKLVFLHPASQAKTARIEDDGVMQVLDGPFRDGPEQVGGYYIIEADSLDEAVQWARRGRVLIGSNEVRQIADLEP